MEFRRVLCRSQTLLSAADKDKLGTALKGASETLRDFFFSNMSERAAKIMKEDMQSMGPVRLKDVDAAQMYMVATAKELAERGEIIISENRSEEHTSELQSIMRISYAVFCLKQK